MSDDEFRVLLDLLMVSDPWPLEHGQKTLESLADSEARHRGFVGWVEAYHNFEHPGMRQEIP